MPEKDIKVSVIVPVYNTEQYLRECLESLEKQTLSDMEFIVIDDGSTDKSYEIMQEYAKADKRFKIFTQENSGVGITRNRGLALAKGKYVGYVDSDDYVSPTYFEKLYLASEKYNADVAVIANVMKFSENYMQAMDLSVKSYVHLNILPNLYFLIGDAAQQWDKIYKKEFLRQYHIQSFETRLWFEDEWFSTLVALYAKRIAVTDKALYYYRYRPNGVSGSYKVTPASLEQGVELYDSLIEKIEGCGLEKNIVFDLSEKIRKKRNWFIQTYKIN